MGDGVGAVPAVVVVPVHVVELLLGAGAAPAAGGPICAAAVLPDVVAYGVPLLRGLLPAPAGRFRPA